MEKKSFLLVLLLLLFLIDELVVESEARVCYSRSKKFHGRCFFRNHMNNCKAICKQEKFTSGRCSRGSCFCSRKCDVVAAHPPPPPPPVEGGGDESGGGEEGGESGPQSLLNRNTF